VAGQSPVPIVARGSGVQVPWDVRDALARDMSVWGFGGAEFDVSLTVPYQGRWKVALCKAMVGDAAALRVGPCNVTDLPWCALYSSRRLPARHRLLCQVRHRMSLLHSRACQHYS
jgi:hypothetical protein